LACELARLGYTAWCMQPRHRRNKCFSLPRRKTWPLLDSLSEQYASRLLSIADGRAEQWTDQEHHRWTSSASGWARWGHQVRTASDSTSNPVHSNTCTIIKACFNHGKSASNSRRIHTFKKFAWCGWCLIATTQHMGVLGRNPSDWYVHLYNFSENAYDRNDSYIDIACSYYWCQCSTYSFIRKTNFDHILFSNVSWH